jgi:hypothetical protein
MVHEPLLQRTWIDGVGGSEVAVLIPKVDKVRDVDQVVEHRLNKSIDVATAAVRVTGCAVVTTIATGGGVSAEEDWKDQLQSLEENEDWGDTPLPLVKVAAPAPEEQLEVASSCSAGTDVESE